MKNESMFFINFLFILFYFIFKPLPNEVEPQIETGNRQIYFICLFHVSEHVDHFKASFFFIYWQMNHPPNPIKKFQLEFIFIFKGFPKGRFQ
jgi:hypothetical protein